MGSALVLSASHGGGWWASAAGALVIGATTSSWISLAMLAVIEETSRGGRDGRSVGHGRGMLGFYLGIGIGPPTHGFLVDHIGTYDVVWSASIVDAALAAGTVRVWVVPPRVTERGDQTGCLRDAGHSSSGRGCRSRCRHSRSGGHRRRTRARSPASGGEGLVLGEAP